MASGGGNADGEPEFQIAPMIDVLLVLLIFFMSIASTAVTRYDPSINLPVASEASRKDDSQDELVFNVAWRQAEGVATTTFEEHRVEVAGMVPILQERLRMNPKARVLIRSDADTPVRWVSEIVAMAAKAGISEVTFAAVIR